MLTAPSEELTRVEIAPTADPAGSRACTILDGLVVCTLGTDGTGDGSISTRFVVTAYTEGSAQGKNDSLVADRLGDSVRLEHERVDRN